jgi:hypothetical protein
MPTPRLVKSDAWIDPQLTADSCVARATGRCSVLSASGRVYVRGHRNRPGPHMIEPAILFDPTPALLVLRCCHWTDTRKSFPVRLGLVTVIGKIM